MVSARRGLMRTLGSYCGPGATYLSVSGARVPGGADGVLLAVSWRGAGT
jgi:hypothetical protein